MKKAQDKRSITAAAKKIKLLALDVDGVLTDGGIIFDNEGNELKVFNVRDGHGIKMAQAAGIHVAIITGRSSRAVARRAAELGITDVYQGSNSKLTGYTRLLEKYSLKDNEAAFVGDDIVDIPVLKRVGLPVVVADATDEARRHAILITKNRGGHGAVREVTDLLVRAAGKWKELLNEYDKN
jgi:3-deoxy-D-manno-octulosonate 8-phosphate phosphatase (KDO 8-P phosphatase)